MDETVIKIKNCPEVAEGKGTPIHLIIVLLLIGNQRVDDLWGSRIYLGYLVKGGVQKVAPLKGSDVTIEYI